MTEQERLAAALEYQQAQQPARMNPNLAAQGARGRANMMPPTSIMDERYPAFKRNQEDAEKLMLGLDIVGSAIPLAGPAIKGAKILGQAAAPQIAQALENYTFKTGMALPMVERQAGRTFAAPQDEALRLAQERDNTKNIISGIGDELITLYHGTSKSSAKKIKDEGVIKSGSYFGNINGVSLTPRKSVAEDFANGGEIIEVKVPKSKLVVDPESVDNFDLDDAIRNGNSVFATGNIYFK